MAENLSCIDAGGGEDIVISKRVVDLDANPASYNYMYFTVFVYRLSRNVGPTHYL